jgi:oxalate decarboxylase/phosphoglucose isomerase-like protein (cupin superfamily)
MPAIAFPKLQPPAVDSAALEAPFVVNERDVKPIVEFPLGGGATKWLLTEENGGCRYINVGLFFADPGQGSQWHTHPAEAEEEEYLFVIEGQGTMFYKHGGREHQLPFSAGAAIFTGHLTHYIRNTGTTPLKIYFSIAPLPVRTIIHGVKNDDGGGYRDSLDLKPPQLIRQEQIEVTGFTKGGLLNRKMLNPATVGARHGRFGTAWETPGTGSFWHTHPIESRVPNLYSICEEDLFYTISGKGTYVYLHGGKVETFEFRDGDAVHSRHVTNYTTNHTDQELVMVFSGAPDPPATITHELA